VLNSIGRANCYLCEKSADVLPHQEAAAHLYCENCGEYIITIQAITVLEYLKNDIKYILSSQTFEKYYYEKTPLLIQSEHIHNAKDVTLLEKLYKLSKYIFCETKITGLGSRISIRCSRFYCRNNEEYLHLLETLKSLNIVDFEEIDSPSGAKGTYNTIIGSPKLLGNAILVFEKGIESAEKFKETFMHIKNDTNQIELHIKDGKNQFNFAINGSNISATQNNTFDIKELNTLLENVFNSLPQDISNEERNNVKENLEFIKSETQSPNPKKAVIKSILTTLGGIAKATGFLASLAKLAEYLNLYVF